MKNRTGKLLDYLQTKKDIVILSISIPLFHLRAYKF